MVRNFIQNTFHINITKGKGCGSEVKHLVYLQVHSPATPGMKSLYLRPWEVAVKTDNSWPMVWLSIKQFHVQLDPVQNQVCLNLVESMGKCAFFFIHSLHTRDGQTVAHGPQMAFQQLECTLQANTLLQMPLCFCHDWPFLSTQAAAISSCTASSFCCGLPLAIGCGAEFSCLPFSV